MTQHNHLNILQGGKKGGLIDRNGGEYIAMKLLNNEEEDLNENERQMYEYIKEELKKRGYTNYNNNKEEKVINNDNDREQDKEEEIVEKKKSAIQKILEIEKELYSIP
ncbi:hypothetical protein ABK040_010725 [Willaertia magna]